MAQGLLTTHHVLPDDKEAMGSILQDHAFREEYQLAVRWTRWLIADAYMRGYRHFWPVPDFNKAIVNAHILDRDGKLPVEISKMLEVVNKTIGLMASQDYSPSVIRPDSSRDAIRQRSLTQIVADSLVPSNQLEEIVTRFLYILSTLGCCGIAMHIEDNAAVGLTATGEVIHPRELFPWPSLGWNYALQRGLVRQRLVPISDLTDRYKIKEDDLRQMYVFEKMIGERLDEDRLTSTAWGQQTALYTPTLSLTPSGGQGPKKVTNRYVKVREMWIEGARGTCEQYVLSSGRKVIENRKYEEYAAYCPVGVARFFETGTFHGAGLFDLLFSVVREGEKMVQQLIHNVKKLDNFPVALIPHGLVNERIIGKETGDQFKFATYSVDPSMLGSAAPPRPIQLTPPNSGEMPGKTAQFLFDMIEQASPVRDLITQKGRVDSMAGLQYLEEQASKSTVVASGSAARAFGTAYRAMVATGLRAMLTSKRALPVTRLTADVAGAVIDFKNSTVTLTSNALPDITRVDFGIRNASPQSVVARKQEALAMAPRYSDGNIRLAVWSFKEGVPFSIDMSREDSAYETVQLNILVLYNDGEQPGQLVLTQQTEYPDLQLYVVKAFMASTKMRLGMASQEVIDSFLDYHDQLMMFAGSVLPEQVPEQPPPAPQQTIYKGQAP